MNQIEQLREFIGDTLDKIYTHELTINDGVEELLSHFTSIIEGVEKQIKEMFEIEMLSNTADIKIYRSIAEDKELTLAIIHKTIER